MSILSTIYERWPQNALLTPRFNNPDQKSISRFTQYSEDTNAKFDQRQAHFLFRFMAEIIVYCFIIDIIIKPYLYLKISNYISN